MSEFVNTSDLMGGDDEVLDAILERTITSLYDNRLTKLYGRRFSSCNSLSVVNFPNLGYSVSTPLATSAFAGVSALQSITLGSVSYIPSHTFNGCSNLLSFSIPNVVSIYSNAFRDCRSLTSIVLPSTTISIGSSAFYNCQNITYIEGTGVKYIYDSAFYNCKSIQTVSFPACIFLYVNAFSNATIWSSVYFPVLSTLSHNAFAGATIKVPLNLPNVERVYSYAFSGARISIVNMPNAIDLYSCIGYGSGPDCFDFTNLSTISRDAFQHCGNLAHLVLRNSSVCTLTTSMAFHDSPIEKGIGHIYVPDNLVEEYKDETNWSDHSDVILPISEYPAEPTSSISDSWQEIFASELDGTYRTKYHIGDEKFVNIGDTRVLMKIVAMDADILADDPEETAPITWMSSYVTGFNVKDQYGTGSAAYTRSYLNGRVFNSIETQVKENIKTVSKTYLEYQTTTSYDDNVWVPSLRETCSTYGLTYMEDSGPIYSETFSSNNDRTMPSTQYGCASDILSGIWQLRSKGQWYYYYIDSYGRPATNGSDTRNMVICFCT